MNRYFRFFKLSAFAALFAAVVMSASSCSDNKSYAELLTDEEHAINVFLAQQNVILYIPADGKFITGADAPYYRIDEEGNVFMQIINEGDMDVMAKSDQLIYFRFSRYNLYYYDSSTGLLPDGWGNSDDLTLGSTSFRYGNYSLSSSSQWGSGLQAPLQYVGMNSHVRLIIRSQYGLSDEISSVIPYLYDVRYMLAGTSGQEPGDDNVD